MTFRTASTVPTDPQIRQKCDSTAGELSGIKVATPIAIKLVIVMTSPTRRRCGAGSTVIFIGLMRDPRRKVSHTCYLIGVQTDSALLATGKKTYVLGI